MRNESVLVISDQHFPFHHPDTIPFLKALKKKLKPDRVINIGDELDFHALSFHDSDPDLPSSGPELEAAILAIKPLYDLFPEMDLIESNHGSLVYRKAKHHGLPRQVIKSYREVIGAPKGWRWHFDLTLKLPNGERVYFHHGKSAEGIKLSQAMGMNVVQGHYHERFAIQKWATPLGVRWSMQVGCLIDDESYAFAYNKTNLKSPIIGCGSIINGQPKLQIMPLDKKKRWTGELV